MSEFIKKYPTIGCCGLDCGLCPKYYTIGSSKCPGCCGSDFFNKHPSCSFITCCVKKNKLEVCADCKEFPCSKFDGFDAHDSFITHRNSISNLRFIKKYGMEEFIEQQGKRMKLLDTMLKHFNDGRSKSFYCIAVTLLSIDDIEKALKKCEEIKTDDIKIKAKILKKFLNSSAAKKGTDLKLIRKMK
ncbi:MAG: DUF3795 domain-containing protein [Thermoplasmata archaeon]|nr:MAG: DUF3795 domain-containing protein [Thermoplasmata archaeon]